MKREVKLSKKEKRPRVVLVNRCIIFNKKGSILLIQRSLNDYHAPGLWEFPGGKLEEGQDLVSALEREVFEETNLLINTTTRIAYTESQIIPKGKYKGLPYVVIVGIGKISSGTVKLSEEHINYKWVSIKEAFNMPIKEEIRKSLLVLQKDLKKQFKLHS